MRRGGLSSAGLSVLFALGLALWEVYFFWLVPSLDGTDGLFTPERLGFNMAWLAAIYLTFQLISIPFALPSATGRFIGVVAQPPHHGCHAGYASLRCPFACLVFDNPKPSPLWGFVRLVSEKKRRRPTVHKRKSNPRASAVALSGRSQGRFIGRVWARLPSHVPSSTVLRGSYP